MLLGGDEFGRTQNGNNNAYCQDNDTSWLDWDGADVELLAFVRALGRFRRDHPELHAARWLADGDVAWLRPDAAPMTVADWRSPATRSLEVVLGGFAILFHPGARDRTFVLPAARRGWRRVMDTGRGFVGGARGEHYPAGARLVVTARSLWLLQEEC